MGQNTAIEWTDHTFNPWQGCIRVSPGCQHCYAETLSNRWGKDIWGPGSKRERTSAANWRKPLQWSRQAQKEGRRYKVFCASMADVFEDNEQVKSWRLDLFLLISNTPNLDWQILTKRPDVAREFFEQRPGLLLPNIWMGTSVENQEYADKRIPELLKIPAKVRFLSVEPLLGPIDLSGRTVDSVWFDAEYAQVDPHLSEIVECEGWPIHWVIVGGESGHGARPMHPEWVRKIRDECQAAGVAFFFKQWGEYVGGLGQRINWVGLQNGAYICGDKNTYEWGAGIVSQKVGKHAAGRLLDGRTWDEFPQPQQIGQIALL